MDAVEYEKMNEIHGAYWWYHGRRFVVRTLLEKYLGRSGDKTGSAKVLDLGCGTGGNISIFKTFGRVVGVDSSDTALSFARRNKGYDDLFKMECDSLNFEGEKFDCIAALDVFEHTDDEAALSESYRVLKPGGILIATVPAYQWLWSGHDEVFGHRRRYTRKGFLVKVIKAGFLPLFVSYYVSFLFPLIAAFRLGEKFVRNKRESHFYPLPPAAHWVLSRIIFFEGILLRFGIRFPFGSSIIIIVRKP